MAHACRPQNESYCFDAWPAPAGALPADAQAKLAAHLAVELAMLAGNTDAEPQRTCAPPVAAPGPSPDCTQNPTPRTRRDRAASAAQPAGWLRLAHHLPAALRLSLAINGPLQRESAGKTEDAGQGGASAARAAAATAMRHLAHVQHIAALLTAAAPPPAAPAAGCEVEQESRGAPTGGFFAVLGALNAARAGDAACAGGGSTAAGAREDALLAGVDGWRERARICQVCKSCKLCSDCATLRMCRDSRSSACTGLWPFAWRICLTYMSPLASRQASSSVIFLSYLTYLTPAGAGGGAHGGACPPQAAAAR